MNKEEIIQKVNAALMKEFEVPEEKLVPDATFADLQVDSLDVVDMVITFEQTFKIDIRNNYKPGSFTNLGGLYDFIEKLIKEKNK